MKKDLTRYAMTILLACFLLRQDAEHSDSR